MENFSNVEASAFSESITFAGLKSKLLSTKTHENCH